MLDTTAPELHIGRSAGSKFDKQMIEQRNSALKTMCHAHPILNMKECRQQTLEIEVCHFVEICLLANVFPVIEYLTKCFEDPLLVEKSPIDFVHHIARPVDQSKVARVKFAKEAIAPKLADHRHVFAQHAEIWHDRFNRHDVVAVLVGAVDCCLDALLEVGDQVARIATENLVAALPAEYHLHMPARQL